MTQKYSYNEIKNEMERRKEAGIVDVPIDFVLDLLKVYMMDNGNDPDEPLFTWHGLDQFADKYADDDYDRAMGIL